MPAKQKRQSQINLINVLALFVLITLLGVLRISTGAGESAISLGTSVIYLATYLLPMGLATVLCSTGLALSEIIVGSAETAVPTLIVTLIVTLAVGRMMRFYTTNNPQRLWLPFFAHGLFYVLGNLCFRSFMYGNLIALPVALVDVLTWMIAGTAGVSLVKYYAHFPDVIQNILGKQE